MLSTYESESTRRGIHNGEFPIGADQVNPLAASVFDLPEQLADKADPTLIAADETHLAAIAQSLDHSIADLTARLDAARKSPGGTGHDAMDRDLEVHRVTARLRTLRRFGVDLCLGHMVMADDPRPSMSAGSA